MHCPRTTRIVTGRRGHMSAIIAIRNITKEFKVLNRREGLKGSLKNLMKAMIKQPAHSEGLFVWDPQED